MATVNLDIYALWQRARLITSLTDPTLPSLPTPAAGDTWALRVFYVDDTNPLQLRRFAGSTTQARFIAAGNNHVYASAFQTSEFPADTTPVVTKTQAGGDTQIERETVVFPSLPIGGTFRITFNGAGSGGRGGGTSLERTTAPIPFNASAADILEAILETQGFYQGNSGPYTFADLAARYGAGITSPAVTGSIAAGFVVEFGALYGGQNRWNTEINKLTINDSDLQYAYGWNVSLPLTAGDFANLFTPANGPAYFQIFVDGGLAAQYQLTAAPSGGNAPVFTAGPPPAVGTIDSFYDFTYVASGFPVPTFSRTSGTLPPGLTLAADGRLSGTPTARGRFSGVVTATNSAGAATQAFVITIGGDPTPSPTGVAGPLATYRDGNYKVVEPSDGVYPEDRNDEWPGLIIWHIPYVLDLDTYNATKPAVGSYESPFGYFWKDTPWRHLGDRLVSFERLRHNLPGDSNRPVSVTKNYQSGNYTFANGQLTDMAIDSFSRPIKANCNYHYALDDPGALPVIPVIMIVPFLHGQQMTDLGTGFPRATFNGQSLFDSNFGVSKMEGGGIDHVLGRLFCRRIITG